MTASEKTKIRRVGISESLIKDIDAYRQRLSDANKTKAQIPITLAVAYLINAGLEAANEPKE